MNPEMFHDQQPKVRSYSNVSYSVGLSWSMSNLIAIYYNQATSRMRCVILNDWLTGYGSNGWCKSHYRMVVVKVTISLSTYLLVTTSAFGFPVQMPVIISTKQSDISVIITSQK